MTGQNTWVIPSQHGPSWTESFIVPLKSTSKVPVTVNIKEKNFRRNMKSINKGIIKIRSKKQGTLLRILKGCHLRQPFLFAKYSITSTYRKPNTLIPSALLLINTVCFKCQIEITNPPRKYSHTTSLKYQVLHKYQKGGIILCRLLVAVVVRVESCLIQDFRFVVL